ncbi:MAG: hypothetical protein E7812_01115 [Phenylobacterium sp.]|nr:MAG: hypothetical protein E7812_01115 [Phenylobacterium sp.]
MDEREEKRLHDSMRIVGLRATVTAVGLLKLTGELVRAGVLDDEAVGRIKQAMVKELSLTRPPSSDKAEFERSMRHRLDGLFAGSEKLEPVPPVAE